MAKLTPQEFREKHARNLKNSTMDIQAGVTRVTEAPGKKAAAKADKMKANLVRSIDDGTWAKRVGAVTLEDWKSKMIDKGIGRIASGIDAAGPKVEAFASQLLPAIDAAQAKVKGMPDMTLDDNINRMVTMTREMAKFKKR
jgi:hypothetical protein